MKNIETKPKMLIPVLIFVGDVTDVYGTWVVTAKDGEPDITCYELNDMLEHTFPDLESFLMETSINIICEVPNPNHDFMYALIDRAKNEYM